MIQMEDEQFNQMLLAMIDIHAKAYPDVYPELAAARAKLKRYLCKSITDCCTDKAPRDKDKAPRSELTPEEAESENRSPSQPNNIYTDCDFFLT